jgi:hypothetical protein
VNHIKQLNRAPSFVRLQVANQMPARRRSAHYRDFCLRFLNAILSQVGYATRDRLLNDWGRMGLAYGHQCNILRPAIDPKGGRSDLRDHARQLLTKLFLALRL